VNNNTCVNTFALLGESVVLLQKPTGACNPEHDLGGRLCKGRLVKCEHLRTGEGVKDIVEVRKLVHSFISPVCFVGPNCRVPNIRVAVSGITLCIKRKYTRAIGPFTCYDYPE